MQISLQTPTYLLTWGFDPSVTFIVKSFKNEDIWSLDRLPKKKTKIKINNLQILTKIHQQRV